jgi:bacterioferritin-associated ferredoxin
MNPTIVCLCHDVSIEDIDRAVAHGYTDPETIKRFTGALMGPCQGKACADQVMEVMAGRLARLGVERDGLRSPTTRPPAFPLRLGQLSGGPVVDP